MDGGKLVCKTGKFCHTQELKGGEMIEVRWASPTDTPSIEETLISVL